MAAEFVLIIVGVLIALAVDTAFRNREDDSLRAEYIVRIHEDIDFQGSLFAHYNKADTSRPGSNPSQTYRETIRGIIPNDVQRLIRDSELGVMRYLMTQQVTFANEVLQWSRD